MTSFTYRKQLTIEWGQCDPAGIVFNSRFFEMFDASTWRMFEAALGVKPHELAGAFGIMGIPLVDVRANFVKAVKFGDVLRVRLSRDLQMILHEVEAHRRGAGGGLNIQLVSHRSDSQMVALRAKNAWVASTSVKLNSMGLEARRAISMKPRPAPLLPSSGSALSCSL